MGITTVTLSLHVLILVMTLFAISKTKPGLFVPDLAVSVFWFIIGCLYTISIPISTIYYCEFIEVIAMQRESTVSVDDADLGATLFVPLVLMIVTLAFAAWLLWAKFMTYKYLKEIERQQMSAQNIAMS